MSSIPSANDASVDVKAVSSGIKTAPVSPDVNVIAEKRETVVTPVDAGTVLIADDRDWPRPQFLQEEKKLTAAERGTILHSVMQHLDLRGDLTFHGVKNQLARMEAQGILLPEKPSILKASPRFSPPISGNVCKTRHRSGANCRSAGF